MSTDVEVSRDGIVIIDDRDYNILKPPPYSDPLVQAEVAAVLQTLDLAAITENLSMSVELFWVAYNGVAGARVNHESLQARVVDIQTELALTCNECVLTMTSFKRDTNEIIRQVSSSYRWLLRTKENIAIKKLARCAEAAERMADAATDLATRFQDLQGRTTDVHIASVQARDDQHWRIQELEEEKGRTRELKETQQKNADLLLIEIGQIETQRLKAEDREETAAKRAFAAQIVGAVAGALGGAMQSGQQVLGAVIAAKTGGAVRPQMAAPAAAPAPAAPAVSQAGATPGAAPAQSKAQADAKVAAQQALANAQANVDGLAKDIVSINGDITKVNADLSVTPAPTGDALAALQDELARYEAELAATQADKDKADAEVVRLTPSTKKSNDAAIQAALAGGAAAFDSAAGSANAMATSQAQDRQEYAQLSMQLLQQEMNMKKEQRLSLMQIAGATEKLKNLDKEQHHAEVSEEALDAANGALGQIVGLLINAALFWRQMAEVCKALAESDLIDDIEDLSVEDPEDRLEIYTEPFFVEEFLSYLCRWVALNGLADEYLVKAAAAQQKAVGYLGQAPSIEQALANAPALADEIQKTIAERLEASDTVMLELERSFAEFSDLNDELVGEGAEA